MSDSADDGRLQAAHAPLGERLERLSVLAEAPARHDGDAMPTDHPPVRTCTRIPPPRNPLKRAERYFSALFKLGGTYKTSLQSARRLDEQGGYIEHLARDTGGQRARLDAMEQRFDDIEARLDRLESGLRDAHFQIDEHAKTSAAAASEVWSALATRDEAAAAESEEPGSDDGTQLLEVARLEGALEELRGRIAETGTRSRQSSALLSRAFSDLTMRFDLLRHRTPPEPEKQYTDVGDALLDSFYNRLEARYRGPREEIRQRLVTYLPDARGAVERTGKPVLDLGCGRGEWLEVLREHGIAASGVDLNPVQVEEARAAGLDVRVGDASAVLSEAPDASVGLISAHHLIEHLPFETFAWIVREALRVLAPGGALLLETPNIHNLMVASISFHVDPTHRQPLPQEVITTLLDTIGYERIELRFLHPHPRFEEFLRGERLDPEIAGLFFGPQDLGVLAIRPTTGDA